MATSVLDRCLWGHTQCRPRAQGGRALGRPRVAQVKGNVPPYLKAQGALCLGALGSIPAAWKNRREMFGDFEAEFHHCPVLTFSPFSRVGLGWSSSSRALYTYF